jgi:hypothetical protein
MNYDGYTRAEVNEMINHVIDQVYENVVKDFETALTGTLRSGTANNHGWRNTLYKFITSVRYSPPITERKLTPDLLLKSAETQFNAGNTAKAVSCLIEYLKSKQ